MAPKRFQFRALSKALNGSLVKGERGASMMEYALLASLIAVAAISSVQTLGFNTRQTFREAGEPIQDTLACAGVSGGTCSVSTPTR